MGWPADMPVEVQWPDGIRRDRERTRESLAFIRQHPVWYAGRDARTHVGHVESRGRSGAVHRHQRHQRDEQEVSAASIGKAVWSRLAVNVLGMIQSVVRYLFLPLAAFGIYVGDAAAIGGSVVCCW